MHDLGRDPVRIFFRNPLLAQDFNKILLICVCVKYFLSKDVSILLPSSRIKVLKIILNLTGPLFQTEKASAYNSGDLGLIPGQEDSLVKEMATHSSILTWEIQWAEEPAGATVHGAAKS